MAAKGCIGSATAQLQWCMDDERHRIHGLAGLSTRNRWRVDSKRMGMKLYVDATNSCKFLAKHVIRRRLVGNSHANCSWDPL